MGPPVPPTVVYWLTTSIAYVGPRLERSRSGRRFGAQGAPVWRRDSQRGERGHRQVLRDTGRLWAPVGERDRRHVVGSVPRWRPSPSDPAASSRGVIVSSRESMAQAAVCPLRDHEETSALLSDRLQRSEQAGATFEFRSTGESMVNNEIIYQSFSDCFVLSTAFGQPLPVAMMATASLLVQCGSLMPILMAARIPVRGGVEVGYGTLTDDEPPGLVGASLVKAYALESRKAEYPRILIGPELVEVVRRFAEMTPSSKDERLAAGSARYVNQLLWDEPNGTVALDYLNPLIVSMLDTEHPDLLRSAYGFVQESISSARERRDAKQLAPRSSSADTS